MTAGAKDALNLFNKAVEGQIAVAGFHIHHCIVGLIWKREALGIALNVRKTFRAVMSRAEGDRLPAEIEARH